MDMQIHLSSSPKEKELAAEAASFDVKMVARREPGWQSMLEYALLRWVECVIEETRADHSHEVEGML